LISRMKVMSRKCLTAFLFSAMTVGFNVTASAATLTELLETDRVRIKTWIEPRENIIARQQVKLQIEIATDTWFSGGTRIGAFAVKDAILLQREKFALNSSRREDGKDWTVQQWTLLIYPQRGGRFVIPEIPVRVSVAAEDLEAIAGDLSARSLSFVANIPEPILNKSLDEADWVATTRFDVQESFDKSLDDLKPGDAVTRRISMSADDLPSMMLPNVVELGIQGMAVYPKPPQLTDKSNRGNYLAERTQVITYVFEESGEYQLPPQTFYWWNLESESLDSIDLDARNLEVRSLSGLEDAGTQQQSSTSQRSFAGYIPVLKKAGMVFLLLVLVVIVVRRFGKIAARTRSTEPKQLSGSALFRQFESACKKNDLEKAMGLFYQWLDDFGGGAFKGSIRETLNEFDQVQLTLAFQNITRTIYTRDKSNEIDLKSFARKFISELKASTRPVRFDSLRVDLKLN